MVSNRRGSVSIEALLSILLLMVVISVTWGLSIFIYNASMLSTATQLGAQSGLLTFDRGSYRGMTPAEYEASAQRGRIVAGTVFRENTCGMLPDQFSGERPETGCGQGLFNPDDRRIFSIDFFCGAPDLSSSTPGSYWPQNCLDPDRSSAIQVQARSGPNLRLPFSYLTGDSNSPRAESSRGFQAFANAFSFVWQEPTS